MSQRYGQMGIHCCAHAMHQWKHLLKIPNLCLLNLNQPEEVCRKAYEFFAPHTVQRHNWQGVGPAWTYPAQYPKEAHVLIRVDAKSKEHAIELADKLWEACGR